jgi:hypothetical protein
VTSSKVIRSPILIGCVTASRRPAAMLPSGCRAAKPRTRPITALEARMPVASRLISANWLRARARPMIRIETKTRRRTTRSRVLVVRERPESRR